MIARLPLLDEVVLVEGHDTTEASLSKSVVGVDTLRGGVILPEEDWSQSGARANGPAFSCTSGGAPIQKEMQAVLYWQNRASGVAGIELGKSSWVSFATGPVEASNAVAKESRESPPILAGHQSEYSSGVCGNNQDGRRAMEPTLRMDWFTDSTEPSELVLPRRVVEPEPMLEVLGRRRERLAGSSSAESSEMVLSRLIEERPILAFPMLRRRHIAFAGITSAATAPDVGKVGTDARRGAPPTSASAMDVKRETNWI